jgi:excisionase family DNA binding protein
MDWMHGAEWEISVGDILLQRSATLIESDRVSTDAVEYRPVHARSTGRFGWGGNKRPALCPKENWMDDRWLAVDEIAEYLGIKRDTVYKWISEREMPAHRMGRLWKFRKEDVDQWVKSGGAGDRVLDSRGDR